MKLPILAAGAMLLSTTARADLVWLTDTSRVLGGGDGERCSFDAANPAASNTQVLAYGSQLSLVFRTWGIQLPRRAGTGGPLAFSSSCNVILDLIIPQGYYISALAQTVTGGLVKEKGSLGSIIANAFLFQEEVPLNQVKLFELNAQKVETNALFSRSNSNPFGAGARVAQCARTAIGDYRTTFKYQLLAAGARRPVIDFAAGGLALPALLFNVDVSDVQFSVGPVLSPCL